METRKGKAIEEEVTEVMGLDVVGPHGPLGRPESSLPLRQKAPEGLQQWSGMISLNILTGHFRCVWRADP